MPDPLGPTNPNVSPFWTSREIERKMSTCPAFPLRDNEASVSESSGEVMQKAFGFLCHLGYGAKVTIRNLGMAVVFCAGAVQAEPITIAALGDSLTQGYGLTEKDGFVPQMQAWLDAQGADVVMINAGVTGDTTAGGLSRVAWTLTPDVDAMIVALGGNDFLRGLAPEESRANIKGILDNAQAQGVKVLLVGLEVGTNYGPDYKAQFDALYPELAAEYDVPLYPTFFAGLLDTGDIAAARAAYIQPDGLHPNAEGVSKIVEAMGPAVLSLAQSARDAGN